MSNCDFDGHYITVRLGSEYLDALIDTGAVHSLIDAELAGELKLHVIPKTQHSKPLLSANGSELETVGHVMAELYLKDLKVEQRLEVARSLSPPLILGFDFLRMNQARIDFALKLPMFTLFDGLIELPFYTCCDENNCVTLARTVCVPAYHEAYVQIETPQQFNNQEVLLEQPPCVLSVSVVRALAFCKNNKTVCRVVNTKLYVVTLKKA